MKSKDLTKSPLYLLISYESHVDIAQCALSDLHVHNTWYWRAFWYRVKGDYS